MLRILSVGTRFGSTWMEAAKKSSHWEVAGCVARTKKSLNDAGKKFSIDKKFQFMDLNEAIKNTPDLDAVVITVPNDMHYDLSKIVLENDLHLIIEKPITETWDQAVDLVKLLDERPKLKSCVGQTLRGEIMFRLLDLKLREGTIGDIEHITFRSHWNWTTDEKDNWRFKLPNMFLDDIGIHQIDALRMLSGNKKAVEISAQTQIPKSYKHQNIYSTASSSWMMEDNILVNYFGSMGSKGESLGWYGEVSIFGSKGSMHKSAYGEPYVILHEKKKKISLDDEDIDEIIPMFEFEKIPYILEDFYHAIKDDRPPVTDLHDNINSHAILLSMKKSAEEKRMINVQKEFPR